LDQKTQDVKAYASKIASAVMNALSKDITHANELINKDIAVLADKIHSLANDLKAIDLATDRYDQMVVQSIDKVESLTSSVTKLKDGIEASVTSLMLQVSELHTRVALLDQSRETNAAALSDHLKTHKEEKKEKKAMWIALALALLAAIAPQIVKIVGG
jgi:FtsZ-binding cell division protein ZapB